MMDGKRGARLGGSVSTDFGWFKCEKGPVLCFKSELAHHKKTILAELNN